MTDRVDLRELAREIRDQLIGDGMSGRDLIDQAEEIESEDNDIILTFSGDRKVRLSLEEE